MIVINQTALRDVVHDPDLRHHLTTVAEGNDYRALQNLREYLVNHQLAVKSSGESLRAPWPVEEVSDERDES